MPVDGMAAAEAAIDAGRKHYSDKRYKPALEQFTRAMKACSCARGTKRERCSCKDYEAIAAQDGSIFNEAMYKCHCHIGKTFSKCDRALHIQALDYRAATFEALTELDRARRDAEWILELAPRLPDGYLRLGKIARLQKKHEYAWKIYSAGIDVAQSNTTLNSKKVKQLHDARLPLHKRFCRRDPMHLPAEIVQWIFSHLELGHLAQCLRVSKLWKLTLSGRGSEPLWRSLVFKNGQPLRPPRIDSLRKLVSRSRNDVRHMAIDNCRRFYLTQAKFLALLNGSRNIEHLELSAPYEPLKLPNGYKKLRRLVLDGFENQDSGLPRVEGRQHCFLTNIADTLEHIHFVGVPVPWFFTETIPQMPRLKFLRLEQKDRLQHSLPILHLISQAPELEQLWLKKISLTLEGDWGSKWETLGKTLKVLVIEDDRTPSKESLATTTILTWLNGGRTLQCIDMIIPWQYDKDRMQGQGFPGVIDVRSSQHLPDLKASTANDYNSLRCLRMKGTVLSPYMTSRSLGNPLDGPNSLRTFDIMFPLDSFDRPIGEMSDGHLKDYHWLRGASSITCMGVFNFRFKSYPRNDDDLPLPAFLASFPNLEILEISSEHYEDIEFCSVVEAILKVTHLKSIYQDRVTGAIMDKLRALTEGYGVRLIWGERPRPWPMPVE